MKVLIIVLSLILIFSSCSDNKIENEKFIKLADSFIEQYLEIHPEWATSLGEHRYDHRLNNYKSAVVKKEVQFLTTYQDSLKTINRENFTEVNQIDYDILSFNIEKRIFNLTVIKSHENNPLSYNVGGAIYSLLARDFAPLEKRLNNLRQRMQQIPLS